MSKPPDPDQIMVDLLSRSKTARREEKVFEDLTPKDVIRILGPVLTRERKKRIDHVISGRTRSIVPVVEGVLNTGNVSAVMRTSEALGLQDFHVITNGQPYKHSVRTSTGAEKWLDVRVWREPGSCAGYLKQEGYRILVTHLDERSAPISSLDFSEKTALVFGNELNGASEAMLSHADGTCLLPVLGFVQSYNVSVAAAISLYHARGIQPVKGGQTGDLTEEEATRLRAAFFIRATANADDILARTIDALQNPGS